MEKNEEKRTGKTDKLFQSVEQNRTSNVRLSKIINYEAIYQNSRKLVISKLEFLIDTWLWD